MQNDQIPLSACVTSLPFPSPMFSNLGNTKRRISEFWKKNDWAGKVSLQRETGFCSYPHPHIWWTSLSYKSPGCFDGELSLITNTVISFYFPACERVNSFPKTIVALVFSSWFRDAIKYEANLWSVSSILLLYF